MLVAIAVAHLLGPGPAGAVEYDVSIEVDSEEALYDLRNTGEIDDETFQALLDLYRRGVNLNTAGRDELYSLPNLTYRDVEEILAYRRETGGIADPIDLVATGVLDAEKLAAIASFVTVESPTVPGFQIDGRARYRTVWTSEDDRVPPMAQELRTRTFDHLHVGAVGVLTRNDIADVRYDPARDALSAEPPATRVEVPKYYVHWEAAHWEAVAGTYTIGFGERLVFDNTGRYQPRGIDPDDTIFRDTELTLGCKETTGELAESPCDGPVGSDPRVTPDYRWTERLRGAAVGANGAEIGGVGTVDAYAFASVAARDINQFQLVDLDECSDPRDDDDPDCSSPDVFRRDAGDPLAPTSRFLYYSLPDMYRETVAGAHASWWFHRRARLGVTGYGAQVDWLVEEMNLGFQEWAPRPNSERYGAVGVVAGWGRGWADLAVEVAHTHDGDPYGGGGPAAVLRHTATWAGSELELVGRWYSEAFANPFGRPVAAADEYEGLRARDEAGARVRYTGTLGQFRLRGLLDLWTQPSEGIPKARAYMRGDLELYRWWRPGLWLEAQDKDLSTDGRGECYDVSAETDISGEPVSCRGVQYTAVLRSTFRPVDELSTAIQYQQRWRDENAYATRFRQDQGIWLIVAAKPADRLRLRSRVHYTFEDTDVVDRGERSVWAYVDSRVDLGEWAELGLRYDVRAFVDKRASTAARVPNPEHWFHGEVSARF